MQFSKSLIPAAILLFVCALTVSAVTPEVPRTIAYQGYLTDNVGDPVADGAHVVQFHIWNDPTLSNPGNDMWFSGVTAITTTNGLYDILLGAPGMNPIDPDIFVDSNLWLGVTIGADPELSPRTKLTTAPYAFNARIAQSATEAGHAASADALTAPVDHGSLSGLGDDDHPQYILETGDDMIGDLNFVSGVDLRSAIEYLYGGFFQYGNDGLTNGRMWGNNWGQIQLWDNQVGNVNTIEINAQSSSGGEVIVRDASGSQTHRLDAGNSGNSSVVFPNDAISADETLEEPGISRAKDAGIILSDATVLNITSATITVPGPGYVVARASGYGQIYGTTIGNIIFYIAETSTENTTSIEYTVFGSSDESISVSEYRWGSLSTERTFAVGAGAHTYYVNAYQGWDGGSAWVNNVKLLLTYYPTSYGTVSAIANGEMVNQFDNVSAIQTTTGVATGDDVPTTVYSVDLQELVEKAKAARAAAEQAELELRIALKKQNPASSSEGANSENK